MTEIAKTPAGEMVAQPRTRPTGEQRREILSNLLTTWLAAGWTIKSRDDYAATISKGKGPNHIAFILVGILLILAGFVTLTAAWWLLPFWLLFWIIDGIFQREKQKLITVDEFGGGAERKL